MLKIRNLVFDIDDHIIQDLTMETGQIPEELERQSATFLESQSLYELVLQRFENTLENFEDGFPAAFDALSVDILLLLNKLREFVVNCFKR